MLREAIAIIRSLWDGGEVYHYGAYYNVEEAQIHTLPQQLPPIYVAAGGPEAAKLAGEIADGMVGTAPTKELTQTFQQAGGKGKPRIGQYIICYARDEAEAKRQARERWANSAIPGNVPYEIKTTEMFDTLTKGVSEDELAKQIVCSPDPGKHLDQVRLYAQAGYDHIMVHNVGEDEDAFFAFYEREVLPRARGMSQAA